MEFAERLSQLGESERPEIIFVSGNAGLTMPCRRSDWARETC